MVGSIQGRRFRGLDMRMRSNRGFTIVELLIVILIISILMAFLMPALTKVLCRGRAARCHALVRAICTANETYQAHNDGVYPPSDAGSPPGSVNCANKLSQLGPRNMPYIEQNPSSVSGTPPQFVNQTHGVEAGSIHGVIHYRNNQAVGVASPPPPATAHPTAAVRPGSYDLWGTGCELNEVSAINNWN